MMSHFEIVTGQSNVKKICIHAVSFLQIRAKVTTVTTAAR